MGCPGPLPHNQPLQWHFSDYECCYQSPWIGYLRATVKVQSLDCVKNIAQ